MNNLLFEMKKIVEDGKRNGHSNEQLRVELKEYLQNFVLDFLYNSEFKELIFYGGSSLRIIYGLPRMSEDLDFEVEIGKINVNELALKLEKYFESNLLMKKIKIAPNKENSIARILLSFPIMSEVGLSPIKDETLKIKVEIRFLDHEYFRKINWVFTPFSKFGKTFVIKHYDLSNLMSTKLAAVLQRPQKGFHRGKREENINFKGRDYYDLLWYMEKGIQPNEKMLKAIGIKDSIETIFDKISVQISKMDLRGIKKDIENLFVDSRYVERWIEVFSDTFLRYKKDRYSPKKNLKLDEVFIGRNQTNGCYLLRFAFIPDNNSFVTFTFHISFFFLKFKAGEVESVFSLEDKKKVIWGLDFNKEDKNRLLGYASIFLRLIKKFLKDSNNSVYFNEWQSKFISMSKDNFNPKEEIYFIEGSELENKELRLEDFAK